MTGAEIFIGLILWWILVSSIFVWVIYEREYRKSKKSPVDHCLYGSAERRAGASEAVLPSGTPGAEASHEWTPEEWLR